MRPIFGGILALCITLLAVQVSAQGVSRTITVTGSAQVSRVPDRALLEIGVEREGPTSQRAIADMTRGVSSVLGVLSAAGIPEAQIRTSAMRLAPVRPDEDRLPGTPRAVSAETRLTITVSDLDALGPLIDDIVRSGANRIDGVTFTLADPRAARAAAQAAAMDDARRSAETYAGAAGLQLGPIRSISDGTGPVMPRTMESLAANAVPVAPGTLDVTARVTVVFGLGG